MPTKKATTTTTKNQKPTTNPEIGPNEVIKTTFSWEKELASLYKKAVATAAKKVRLDGFRPGKVPAEIAEEKLDPEALAKEVLNQLIPARYQKLIEEKNLKPIANPEFILVEIDKGKDWIVEINLAQKPEIKLPKNYAQILADTKKNALTKIEKRVADAKKNQKEGQKATTKPEVNPELDRISQMTDDQKISQALDEAVLALRAEIKPVIPELLLKIEAQRRLQDLLDQLKQVGLELDDYLHNAGIEFEQLADQVTAEALKTVQIDFILREIMAEQKFAASETEIDAKLDELLAPTPEKMSAENKKLFGEQKKNPDYRRYAQGMIEQNKLIEWLKAL